MNDFKDHIVVFIDFLGFKNFCESKNDEMKEFIDFLKQIKNLDSDASIQEGKNNSKILRTARAFYSDSLVLAWPLDKSQRNNIFDYGFICQDAMPLITQIAVRALSFGLLTRGAITVGKYYHSEGIFFGKALNEASELEKHAAIYPRIIISKEIIERQLIQPAVRSTNQYCEKIYITDKDDVSFLNYLSVFSFNTLFKEKRKLWIENSTKIINERIRDYRLDEKNIKLLQKWAWFSNYFRSSIDSLKTCHPCWFDADLTTVS